MLYKKPHSCPFAPRCKWVIEKCRMENPPLLPIEEGHRAACWVNIEDREVRDAE
jgi:oligopeptide/dipeptide ABC transporter ATP-binding protein